MIKDNSNPEEEFLERLVDEYGYSIESIRKNVSLSKGQARYKVDMIVYQQGKPFIIIEIKSPLKGATWEMMEQLRQYVSVSEAKYGVISDGINLLCYVSQKTPAGLTLEKIPDIPQADFIDNKHLSKTLDSKHLQDIAWNEFDYLRGKGKSTTSALLGISQIIAAKFYDEKENKSEPSFHSNPDEDAETVKSRMESILLNISKKFGLTSHEIQLEPLEIKEMVIRLQKFSISKSELTKDGLNTLYTLIINERELRELVTPLNLIKFCVGLAGVQKNHHVIDPACGLGGFLVEAKRYGASIFGADISQTVVDIAKINMYLIGENPLNVICQDSLRLIEKNSLDSQEISHEQYDLFITNPPFNYKILDERLNYYHLTKSSGGFSESLFLELGTKLVKNNGKIVIIVPDGFLFNSQNERMREFLLKNFKVAVISLPAKMFSVSAIRTSILVLTKTRPELNQPMFLARVLPIDVKKSPADSYREQFDEILLAYREYEQRNIIRPSENIILAKTPDSKRLDFDFYEKVDHEKFKHETRLLGEIAELQVGTKSEHLKEKTGEFEIFPVRGQNIKDFTVDSSLILPIKIDRELSYKYITEPYDILMTRTGNPGKVGIVDLENISLLVKDNLIRIRPNRNIVDPYYLFAFLSSTEGQDVLQRISIGSTIKAINLQNLSTLKIPIPPYDEQMKIANELKKLLELKNEIKSLMTETEKRKELVEERINNLFQRRKIQ
ncbi:MAG TPA: N-6 DNA methylase [Nitrosopumilaceae archaeon]|nr:N-6 DNA methylase [Nitrosopumilaceae archaeon]